MNIMKENKLTTRSKIQQDFQNINVFDDLDFRVEEISNRFLQHVLDYMEEENMSRKTLASLIGTSPSYITQLFNNTRTLNFVTIAKIEQALNVRFEVELQEISTALNSNENLKRIRV
jgi:ribosome-binding protein aMBF1 (putative translation factor)